MAATPVNHISRKRDLARRCRGWAVAALLPLLGGCVAAAAIPVLAGGALTARGGLLGDGDASPGVAIAAAPVDRPEQTGGSATTGAFAGGPSAAASSPGVRLTGLTALPPPSGSPGGSAAAGAGSVTWQAFAEYALARAGPPAGAKGRASVLLDQPVSLAAPRTRPCRSGQPAVIVDLDPGKGLFDPATLSPPLPELASHLARLREAGIAVIWLSGQPAEQVTAIGAALKQAGLDPDGRDPLLLAMTADDRKQSLRERAGEDACVVAIAGDRRADFDELFDYLRDSASAALLDARLGDGWFLVPPPLG